VADAGEQLWRPPAGEMWPSGGEKLSWPAEGEERSYPPMTLNCDF
jgi:hypothetical protein